MKKNLTNFDLAAHSFAKSKWFWSTSASFGYVYSSTLPTGAKMQYLHVLSKAHTALSLWILGQLSPKFKGCIYNH